MASRINFYIPKDPHKASLNFAMKPSYFLKNNFVELPSSVDVQSLRHSSVLAATLDCGYGLHPKALISAPTSTWASICSFANIKRRMLLSLVEESKPSSCRLKDFADFLEKSDRSSASFAIGQIFCRLATGHWYASFQDNTRIHRYWHLDVAAHPAVSMTGAGPSLNSLNPDYLVEDNHGNWSAVEAKGSLDGLNKERLRDGLRQAAKFPGIRFIDPLSGNERFEPISSAVCVSSYFDLKSRELQVLHLDPPCNDFDNEESVNSLTVVAKAWDLIRYYEALLHYQFYAKNRLEDNSGAIGKFAVRRTSLGGGLSIEITQHHASMATYLDWSIQALSAVTPIICSARRSGSIKREHLTDALSMLAASAISRKGERKGEAERWRLFLSYLRSATSNAKEIGWKDLLRAAWTAPVLPDENLKRAESYPNSIHALWWSLELTADYLHNHIPISNALSEKRRTDRFPTSHGLVVSNPIDTN